MSLQNILSKTREYLNVPAVVRFEHPFMDHLAEDFNTPGYEVDKKDRILVVRKKGLRNPKIVTVHIDRHGIVVNNKGNPEYASFNAKNHYGDENKCSEAVIKRSGQRFIGEPVYAYDKKGKKIEEGEVKGFSYDLNAKNLFFDVKGLSKLPAGTPIAYVSRLKKDNGRISSQIDNVISAAVAHQLVQDGFDGTIIFATEEEIGRSGKYIADYLQSQNLTSQEIITLDTTPHNEKKTISEGLLVLRNKDDWGEFNPNLVNRLRTICKDKGIGYEMRDEAVDAYNAQLKEGDKPKGLGRTELGRIIQSSNKRFNGATIQLPTTGYHTNHETTSELALNNYYEALKRLL